MQSAMQAAGFSVSIQKLCRWFEIPRSTFYYKPQPRKRRPLDVNLVERIRAIIDRYPTYGLRRISALLRRDIVVNRKKVHRVLKTNGWQVRKRAKGHRPRARGMRSRAEAINERWAIDTTHVFCGRDGWCHLTAIIDCCSRRILGWRFSSSGIADVAAAALEEALRTAGIDRTADQRPTLRSDNGLVFGSKAFSKVVRKFRLSQEFITPYTPEQNGMIERFFLSLKEECVWLHNFANKDQAFREIADWIDEYNEERPHSALRYLSPMQFIEQKSVA